MKKTALITLTALVLAGVAHADRTVNETRPLSPDGRVEINNVSGNVEVVGWTGDSVVINGTLDDGVKDLSITSSSSRVTVRVEQVRRRGISANAYLTVKMPVTAGLDVETVSADISVDGVNGELDLEAVSGDIEVSGEPRSLDAQSVSGDVVATSVAGRSELESVSGNVIVRNASGRLDANVVSGDVEIESGTLDSLDAESVSGSIYCGASPTDRGRFSMETMSGTIEMSVSSEMNASFYIETYSGDIKNEIGPPATRTNEYGPGKELRFSTGNASARVSIESFSGNIRLRTK